MCYQVQFFFLPSLSRTKFHIGTYFPFLVHSCVSICKLIIYSQHFSTNVLICLQPSSNKYTYAQKWRIPCLTPAWVLDSVDRGYAQLQVSSIFLLDTGRYRYRYLCYRVADPDPILAYLCGKNIYR